MALADDEIRIVTFNCASGNPRILTPQASFVELPFYAEALDSGPAAAILALQEVGVEHAFALRRAGRGRGSATILEARRPGQGNALVIPNRYEVSSHERGFYPGEQVAGVADALLAWARRGAAPDWRQLGELRTWVGARLRDRRSGRTFTVLNTHLSLADALRARQLEAITRRAHAAAAGGPVILAGDLNDATLGHRLGRLRDMGAASPPPGRPDIDYVLALGFEPVRSRQWTGDTLSLPGAPDAEHVSDHYAEDDVLRFSAP